MTLDELQARTVDGAFFSADGKTLLALLEPKTEYVVPEGVEAIGDCAFWYCKTLRSVTFPAGLQTIGDSVFWYCEALESATFPAGLQSIGDSAFYSCEALESATFPAGLQTVGDRAFLGCNALRSVALLADLQALGEYALGYGSFSLGISRINGFTIYGVGGSVAEEYARANGFRFEAR